jgi:hypothetical protein
MAFSAVAMTDSASRATAVPFGRLLNFKGFPEGVGA